MYILCLTAKYASHKSIQCNSTDSLLSNTDISFIIDFDRGRTYFKNVSMCFNIFLTSKIVKMNQGKYL